MTLKRRSTATMIGCLGWAACVLPGAAWSSNGLNLVGFGSESLGMGSADIPLSRDANAVNINPAGMTQLSGSRLDSYAVPFISTNFNHRDAYNDTHDLDNPFGVFASAAYVRQALHPDLRFGIGMFASGGTGLNYEDLNTRYGTQDDYTAVLAIMKVPLAMAWRVDEQLSLGLAVNLTYSSTRQKIFPKTSSAGENAEDPSDDFYGLRIDGADGLSWNFRLGVQYKATPTVTWGVSYASETDLKLRNGTATFNFTPVGLGDVKYNDVRIDGFALAQEFGAGIAWQVTPRWLVAAELNWLDWSHALRDATLTATRPRDGNAPSRVHFAQALDHNDQYVLGFGVEYGMSDSTRLRAGFNRASNPIPNQTLTPTLNLTQDYEFEVGAWHKIASGWELSTALQYQPNKKERYDNPQQPFGPSVEGNGVLALTLQVGRSW